MDAVDQGVTVARLVEAVGPILPQLMPLFLSLAGAVGASIIGPAAVRAFGKVGV